MGGRGASSSNNNSSGKTTADGKFKVGNTYNLYNENSGYDHDFVVTSVTETSIKGRLTDRIGDFGRDYTRGKEVEYSKGSIAYEQSKLIKENTSNSKARGNKERKEIQSIRNKLDKAGVKYPAGSSLENLKYRYNALKKAGRIK